MMVDDLDDNSIEINAAPDAAVRLMAAIFAKPDLYNTAADAGITLNHFPDHSRGVMERLARAFAGTDDWESVITKFRRLSRAFSSGSISITLEWWLASNFDNLGIRSTVNLRAKYF